jgi:predicted regulator of amino acid metabolism with ACT domain|tara:strand:+ start:131 stop:769 length:639 start_codon:yes stop_codon:yes gene_type:complete
MTNISESVVKLLDRDPAISNCLSRDLINIRALARHIQSFLPTDASIDAIISVIRRYPLEETRFRWNTIAKFLIKLTMRNKIADIALANDPEVSAALGRLSEEIDYGRGEAYRVVAGVEAIRVIIDERNLYRLEKILDNKIVKVTKGLAEIIIALPEEAEKTPGVVSLVTTELATNGINLIEFMSCVPELVLVVEESDALRSYELLQRLSKGL